MSEESEKSIQSEFHENLSIRYSLKEMLSEVAVERNESVLARELVDSSEIDTMFKKNIRRKKS